MSADPIRVATEHWRAHGWDPGEHLSAAVSIYRTDELIRVSEQLALEPHDLTRSRHEALAVLYFSRYGDMPLGRLSDRLLVHPTSITSTVDALEGLGHVARVAHPTDRRTTLARITPQGRKVTEETFRMMAENHCGLSALDERQASRLFGLLRKVRAVAGDIKAADVPVVGRSGTQLHDPLLEAERNWLSHPWATGPYFRTSLAIYRTADLIRLSNDASLRPYKLTHSRHEALAVLYFSRHGEMPMGKLGAVLLVHPTSVTGTVDTLARLGYAERVPHPTDRRTMLARITPAGRQAIEGSNDGMTEARYGLGALTNAQAKSVFNILTKVRLG